MNSQSDIQPQELAALLKSGVKAQFIDVREPVEFAEGHVAGFRSAPLGGLAVVSQGLDASLPIVVMCLSGKRGEAAAGQLRAAGFSQVRNLAGGITAWKASGLSVAGGRRGLPLMRQVQVVIGTGVLTGTILSILVHPNWVYLAMFFGAGMVFAGLSGWCGLALLLAKMPWNRVPNGSKAKCC